MGWNKNNVSGNKQNRKLNLARRPRLESKPPLPGCDWRHGQGVMASTRPYIPVDFDKMIVLLVGRRDSLVYCKSRDKRDRLIIREPVGLLCVGYDTTVTVREPRANFPSTAPASISRGAGGTSVANAVQILTSNMTLKGFCRFSSVRKNS